MSLSSARRYHDSDQLTKTVEINPAQFGVYSHSVGFLNEMKPSKSQIGSCWKFTLPSTPKGQYFLKIKVGEKDFGTGRFNIIN